MTSTIHADKIMNSSGDQDSGLDLLVNDQVKIKTANTDRITITDSAASMGDNFKLKLGIGNDLNLYHDGSNSYIEDTGTGDTHVVSNHIRLRADDINLSNTANSQDAMLVSSVGLVSRPQTPAVFATKSGTEQIFTGSSEVVTNLDSSYYNSYSTNNKSWWDASTSKYTAPTGSGTTYHYVSFSTLMGVTIPSSGGNYGLVAIYHSGTGTANTIYRGYFDVYSDMGTSGNMKFNTVTAQGVVRMVAGNYLQPVAQGSNGVSKRVHSGTYTNFSAVQIA